MNGSQTPESEKGTETSRYPSQYSDYDSLALRKRDWLMLVCLLPVFLGWSLISPLNGWRRVVAIGVIALLLAGTVWLVLWLFR